MVGEFNKKVVIKTLASSKDAGGGVGKSVIDSYSIWAKVENRTGQMNYSERQPQVSYDYKVTVRLYKNRPITTANICEINGKDCKINSVQTVNEGKADLSILRCSIHGGV